jgi:hypothetical protein
MSKSKNECRNLYQVDIDCEYFYALATTQAKALNIVFEKEIADHNAIGEITINCICSENDIVNLNDKK